MSDFDFFFFFVTITTEKIVLSVKVCFCKNHNDILDFEENLVDAFFDAATFSWPILFLFFS